MCAHLHHEVLGENSLKHRVINQYLVVAWREEAGVGVPVLLLELPKRQIGKIDGHSIHELVILNEILHDEAPAVHGVLYIGLIHNFIKVVLKIIY